ncbi:circumsporozoite protein-like [Setaria italica]|uniref:circumsporozoite protein-like n=1 Tax=Setaria italica TaxID=4555 RepID=UPI00064837B7|nr:circumsporozoite protein-like [Setaria italica]
MGGDGWLRRRVGGGLRRREVRRQRDGAGRGFLRREGELAPRLPTPGGAAAPRDTAAAQGWAASTQGGRAGGAAAAQGGTATDSNAGRGGGSWRSGGGAGWNANG